MAILKANTYEKQAMVSVLCAGLAVAAALGAVGILLAKLNFEDWTVQLPRNGRAFPVMAAGAIAACLLGTVGFFVGFSSAGHSRNKRSNLSWLGFFAGAVGVTLGMSALVFYYFTRLDF